MRLFKKSCIKVISYNQYLIGEQNEKIDIGYFVGVGNLF